MEEALPVLSGESLAASTPSPSTQGRRTPTPAKETISTA